VQIDPEDFKRHYAMLSDAALLEIDRDELVDVARACYDAELAERDLSLDEPESSEPVVEADHSPAEGDLQLVGTFLSMEEANFALGLLRSAEVPCALENEFSAAYSGAGALRLLVPAAAYDRACEILEAEISEEDLIAQAEAEAEATEESPES
jgi:putative signal transducing protein